MAKYLFAYKGGSRLSGEAEGAAVMAAWGAWFGELGAAVVEPGAPVAASSTVSADGVSDGANAELSGYSVLQADSLAAATELAKGSPILAAGGTVEVYESHEM